MVSICIQDVSGGSFMAPPWKCVPHGDGLAVRDSREIGDRPGIRRAGEREGPGERGAQSWAFVGTCLSRLSQ